MDLLLLILVLSIVLVFVGGINIIMYRIKEARFHGVNNTKDNKLYALIAKWFLKDFRG
jgi:hypothetical protein